MTEQQTEEKIKNAARIIFLEKGYAATTMRDIAAKAEVNVSLVNYYFRSKEKIFDIIMTEKLQQLFGMIFPYLMDENTTLEEKFTKIADLYIDTIINDPNLPIFVFSEIQKYPDNFIKLLPIKSLNIYETSINKQFAEYNSSLHPAHLMMNFLGMTIFPFIAYPIITNLKIADEETLHSLLLERKKLIPIWMKTLMETKLEY